MTGQSQTRQWHDFDQAYHCSRIGRMVDVTTRVIAFPQRPETQHPIHCSGFATCRLFPLRFFPEVSHLRAPTGCPFMDSLRVTAPR